jgi:hypothetical protein
MLPSPIENTNHANAVGFYGYKIFNLFAAQELKKKLGIENQDFGLVLITISYTDSFLGIVKHNLWFKLLIWLNKSQSLLKQTAILG